MSVHEDLDHPRFFVGADDGEGDELLDPGRVLGYDCLYENVEEEDEDEDRDDAEYDSVCEHCLFSFLAHWTINGREKKVCMSKTNTSTIVCS